MADLQNWINDRVSDIANSVLGGDASGEEKQSVIDAGKQTGNIQDILASIKKQQEEVKEQPISFQPVEVQQYEPAVHDSYLQQPSLPEAQAKGSYNAQMERNRDNLAQDTFNQWYKNDSRFKDMDDFLPDQDDYYYKNWAEFATGGLNADKEGTVDDLYSFLNTPYKIYDDQGNVVGTDWGMRNDSIEAYDDLEGVFDETGEFADIADESGYYIPYESVERWYNNQKANHRVYDTVDASGNIVTPWQQMVMDDSELTGALLGRSGDIGFDPYMNYTVNNKADVFSKNGNIADLMTLVAQGDTDALQRASNLLKADYIFKNNLEGKNAGALAYTPTEYNSLANNISGGMAEYQKDPSRVYDDNAKTQDEEELAEYISSFMQAHPTELASLDIAPEDMAKAMLFASQVNKGATGVYKANSSSAPSPSSSNPLSGLIPSNLGELASEYGKRNFNL